MRKSNPYEGIQWNYRSLVFFGLALLCFSAPFVTGIPQVDESGLVPLVISEELLPPPIGMHAMMDGALEGPTGIPADHSILVLNNTIPEEVVFLTFLRGAYPVHSLVLWNLINKCYVSKNSERWKIKWV